MIASLHAEHPGWSIRMLCRVLGVARSSYAYVSQRDASADLALRDAIAQIAATYPRYGYRRITAHLARPLSGAPAARPTRVLPGARAGLWCT